MSYFLPIAGKDYIDGHSFYLGAFAANQTLDPAGTPRVNPYAARRRRQAAAVGTGVEICFNYVKGDFIFEGTTSSHGFINIDGIGGAGFYAISHTQGGQPSSSAGNSSGAFSVISEPGVVRSETPYEVTWEEWAEELIDGDSYSVCCEVKLDPCCNAKKFKQVVAGMLQMYLAEQGERYGVATANCFDLVDAILDAAAETACPGGSDNMITCTPSPHRRRGGRAR